MNASPRDINVDLPFTNYFISQLPRSSSTMASTLHVNGDRRPSNVKLPSAPSLMMNSHFVPVGESPSREQYEHGIQVIDEDKQFK